VFPLKGPGREEGNRRVEKTERTERTEALPVFSALAGRAVSRVLFPPLARRGWSSVWDGRHRPPRAAYPRLPLRDGRCGSHLAAYLALLRLGVTVPPLLPAARWALTPPFHPYPPSALRPPGAVSFLWPCPSPFGAQALPGSLPCGARTFLGRLAAPATTPLGQRGGIYRGDRLSAIGCRWVCPVAKGASHPSPPLQATVECRFPCRASLGLTRGSGDAALGTPSRAGPSPSRPPLTEIR
jgi:hypothetical protein